jgi:hypothetical protein
MMVVVIVVGPTTKPRQSKKTTTTTPPPTFCLCASNAAACFSQVAQSVGSITSTSSGMDAAWATNTHDVLLGFFILLLLFVPFSLGYF